MDQVIKLDFDNPCLHVWILGKWCLVSHINMAYCEWEYIHFQKLDAKIKETLSKKYNLNKKDFDEITKNLKGRKKVVYEPTKDLRLKILYALNDIEPEKLLKREYWESSVLDCYIAEFTKNKKVLSKLCTRTEVAIINVLKKRDDFKEISANINIKDKPTPKEKPKKPKASRKTTKAPVKKKTTPKKVSKPRAKSKGKSLEDIL